MVGGRQGATRALLLHATLLASLDVALGQTYGCRLPDDQTNMVVDLSPLRMHSGNWRAVNSVDDHTYYLNVCGELNPNPAGSTSTATSMSSGCATGTASACQDKKDATTNATASGFPKILGAYGVPGNYTNVLSWSDRDHHSIGVTMQYNGGPTNTPTSCHGSHARETIITFTCQPGAGFGVPVFRGEDANCVYTFEWTTEYACRVDPNTPSTPDGATHCAVTNSAGVEFDLSPLIRTHTNWEVANGGYLFHLNPCHNLAPEVELTGPCASGAAACQSGGNNQSWSLGTSGAPTIRGNDIVLGFSDGTPCSTGPRHAEVVFHCNPNVGLGEPTYAGESHSGNGSGTAGCFYMFEWYTSVACPPSTSVGTGNCTVYDSVRGINFDLSPLQRTGGYNVTLDQYETTINVCGTVPCGRGNPNAGACQLRSPTSSTMSLLGLTTSTLRYNHGDLWLHYNTSIPCGVEDNAVSTKQVKIFFLCDSHATVSETTGLGSGQYLELKNQLGGCEFIYEYATELACPPPGPQPCIVQDSTTGDVYDLSVLSKPAGAWEVSVPSGGGADRYLINLCMPVSAPECVFHPGNAGCQIPSGGGAFGLGHPQSPILSTVNGRLELAVETLGGSQCHASQDAAHTRSMVINFFCDRSNGLGTPRFVIENDCAYNFEWYTTAACPMNASVGMNCSVTDPVTGDTFDFSSLGRSTDYVVAGTGGFEYNINICRATQSRCYGASNTYDVLAGACQSKPSDRGFNAKSLGHFNGRLEMNGESISLIYEGGQACHGGTVARSTHINFVCPPPGGAENVPTFISEDGNCTYFFEFQTSLACRSAPINCELTSPSGHVYDFTTLMNNDITDGNYEVADPDNGYIYEINLCRSLMPNRWSSCPNRAGACQRPSGGAQGRNIGLPSGPLWDPGNGDATSPGHPYILYTNGEGNCHGQYNRSTRIDFVCPGPNDHNNELQLVQEAANCQYQFIWKTQLACSNEPAVVSGSGCSVTDPVTNTVLDFSSIAGQSFPVHVQQGTSYYVYYLSACNRPADLPCDDSSAMACQVVADSSFSTNCPGGGIDCEKSLGSFASGQIELVNTIPRILYEHGTPCHDHAFNRTTVLEFHCDETAGRGHPEFINETDTCTYIFHWHTALACLPSPDFGCHVDSDGKFYDLTPLSNNRQNWMVTDSAQGGQFVYQINVCRSLVPSTSDPCNVTAGACQSNADGSSAHSLGMAAEPDVGADGTLFLRYTGGDLCHGKYNRQLYVELTCPRDGAGNAITGVMDPPRFLSESSQCEYRFSWRTSAACPLHAPIAGTGCRVTDNLGDTYDLTSLMSTTDYTVTVSPFTYKLSICGEVSESGVCAHAGACQIEGTTMKNMGMPGPLQATSSGLRLEYRNGTQCHNGQYQRSTVIEFQCNQAVTNPQLQFVSEQANCSYTFFMETPAACYHNSQMSCAYHDMGTGNSYDLSGLMRSSENWIGVSDTSTVSNDATYMINVCRDLVTSSASPLPTACVGSPACQVQPGGGDAFPLGSSANGSFSVSSTGNLMLTYDGGQPCSNGQPRRTKIEFVCASVDGTIGHPVIVGEESHCVYKFTWTTSEACPTNPTASTTEGTRVLPAGVCVALNRDGTQVDLRGLPQTHFTDQRNDNDELWSNLFGGQDTFDISPCGTQPCGSSTASVCMHVGGSTSGGVSLGSFKNRPEISGGHVSVRYTGGVACSATPGARMSSVVQYICDNSQSTTGSSNSASSNTIHYVGTSNSNPCEHVFEWRTPAVCVGPPPLQCVVRDDAGHLIDLSSLRREPGQFNWEVADPTTSETILINVCNELTFAGRTGTLPTSCEGAAACRVNGVRGTSIGSLAGEPQAPSNGGVQLWYPDHSGQAYGNLCGTLIMFSCLQGSLGTPALAPHGSTSQIGSNANCVTVINWATSAACVDAPAIGQNCEVQDNVTGVYFNLQALHALSDFRVTTPSSGTITVGVCRAVQNGCGGGACSGSTSLGQANDALRYANGQLALEYPSGGPCSDGGTNGFYMTTIIFECVDSAGAGTPEYDTGLSSTCHHYLHWHTKYACEQTSEVECLAHDSQGHQYDLSPLTRTRSSEGNWVVAGAPAGYEVVINICRGLVADSRLAVSACGDGAAGCQIEGATHRSLGTVGRPRYVGNTLMVQMHNGLPCSNGVRRQTTISFLCDTSGLGQPTFTSEQHCNYNIEWRTSAACSLSAGTRFGTCGISTSSGEAFSLASIGDQGAVSVTGAPANQNYEIAICGANTRQCNRPGAAACVQDANTRQWYSLGGEGGLQSTSRSLTFMITGGDACPGLANYRRSATISFVCDQTASTTLGPVFSRNDRDCFYMFVWRTPLACSVGAAQCVAFNYLNNDNRPKDLGSLDKARITDGADAFTVSPCGALHQDGVCQNAGVCGLVNGVPVNLGSATDQPPTFNADGSVTVTYSGGSHCPVGGSSAATSIVRFYCDNSGNVGQPQLSSGGRPSGGDCTYRFEWHTCVVCPGADPCHGALTTPAPGSPPSNHNQPSNNPQTSTKGTSSGAVAAIVIIIILVVSVVTYFLRSQDNRNALRSMIGMTSTRGYSVVSKQAKKNKYARGNYELSNNLLYGDDSDDDDDSDDSQNLEDEDNAYGSSPLGLGTTETSLSMDILNGGEDDVDMDGNNGDESLLPL